MRSRMSETCGLVYKPVVRPQPVSAALVISQTLPLPLLPATCTLLNDRCGFPSDSISANMRSSFQTCDETFFGWSASTLARL